MLLRGNKPGSGKLHTSVSIYFPWNLVSSYLREMWCVTGCDAPPCASCGPLPRARKRSVCPALYLEASVIARPCCLFLGSSRDIIHLAHVFAWLSPQIPEFDTTPLTYESANCRYSAAELKKCCLNSACTDLLQKPSVLDMLPSAAFSSHARTGSQLVVWESRTGSIKTLCALFGNTT